MVQLQGRRAGCHWAWAHLLPLFGAVHDPARVVRDGEIITGGGVTAGIDFAFTVMAEIAGDDFAQTVQLALEYAPAPPFDAGRPETAPAHVLERFQGGRRKMMETRDEEARVAAQMMAARGHGDVVSDARAR
jgi:transcriptional regulator GlxA family with amidase domain